MPLLLEKLTESDKQQRAWLIVEAHLKEQLDMLRLSNDSFNNTDIKTAAIRGRISFIKELLQAPQKPIGD